MTELSSVPEEGQMAKISSIPEEGIWPSSGIELNSAMESKDGCHTADLSSILVERPRPRVHYFSFAALLIRIQLLNKGLCSLKEQIFTFKSRPLFEIF